MKIRSPFSRTDLNIKKKDHVLEVGSGHNPTYRSNVIVEKFVYTNYHRGGDVSVYPHQEFINADGENLPFADKEFDYVISNHVLEHTENPAQFIKEMERVSKRGYIEVPSMIGESLFPKESHRWLCLEINNKIVFYEKSKVSPFYPDFGRTFLNYLPYQSLALALLYLSYPQTNSVRYEWSDKVEYLINPEDEFYQSFFTKPWTEEMSRHIFPPRTKKQELNMFMKSLVFFVKSLIRSKRNKQKPISLEEYNRLQKNK